MGMYFFSLGWRWECMTQPTGYQRFHQTEEMMVQLCLGTESTFQAAYYWIRLVRYVLECFTQFCRYHSWFFSRKMWAVKTNLQLFRIIVRNWLYSILCILSTMGIVIVLDENLCFHQPVAPKAQSLNWEVPGKSHSILSFFKSKSTQSWFAQGLRILNKHGYGEGCECGEMCENMTQHGRWRVTKRVFLMSLTIKDCDMSWYINVFLVGCLFLFSSCPSFQQYEGLKQDDTHFLGKTHEALRARS